MAVNKVVFGAVSIMDISDSTVTADKLAKGVTAYDKTGEKITGTMEASSAPILQEKTVTPSTAAQSITADNGYDGLSKVTVNGDANLTADNIKSGTSIFGVTGSYAGSSPKLQSKSVTYTSNGTATITPDEGYDGLSSVDVTVNVASGGGGGAGFKVTFPATAKNWNLVSRAELLISNGSVLQFTSYSKVSGKTIENVVGINCIGTDSAFVLTIGLSEGSVAQYITGTDPLTSYLVTISPNSTFPWYYGGRTTFWWPLADTVISKIEMYNTD